MNLVQCVQNVKIKQIEILFKFISSLLLKIEANLIIIHKLPFITNLAFNSTIAR